MMSLSLLPVALISFSILFLYCLTRPIVFQIRRLFSGGSTRRFGPTSYPIIGCLFSFYKNRHRLLDWYTALISESSTNTIVVSRLGGRRTIVTANPQNVEYMLKTNFNNFPKGLPFTEILGDFLGLGIFNVDGELWRAQRKLASHEFAAKASVSYIMTTLEEEVEKSLLPLMASLAERAIPVDLQDLLRRFTFNVICKVSLGIDRCCLDPELPVSPLAKAFDAATEICARRGSAPLFLVWKAKRWLGIGSEKRLKIAVEEVHKHVTEIIIRRRRHIFSGEKSGEDLLARLIAAGHGEEALRDMVVSFVMAGRDTTSAAMTWLFWSLSRNPAVENTVVAEIKSVGNLRYESLKDLRLLKACLCESMRLYPPVAWDSKHAVEKDSLPDGTAVAAGDRVTYFPYGMGRMEALWGKDRLEFKPDRWFLEPGLLKKVSPFKFPIFQAGPRVCLGKEMAFIQMKYVMASVLRRFKITPLRSEPPVFVPLLTAHMAGGLTVSISQR